MTDSNNVIQFPSVHEDTLADALGLERTIANATSGILTTTVQPNAAPVYATVKAPLCPNCGDLYFSHPRMGISHVCKNDVANSVTNDTQYARENLYDVVEKTASSIDKLSAIIEEAPTARSFEVLGQLLSLQSDTSEKLMALQEKRAKLANLSGTAVGAPTSVNIANAVFVGTNAELLDMLKGKTHKIIEHEDMRED